MESLVNKILHGNGTELLNRTTENAEVQEFLSNVPAYMVRSQSGCGKGKELLHE